MPDHPYTKTPAEVYQARLAGLSGQLHRLADLVVQRGTPHVALRTMRLDHVAAATAVHGEVLRGLHNLGLNNLLVAAVNADHPDADRTPGALLDVAAGAVADHRLEHGADTDAAELAEAVLRAVGLLG